MKRDKGNEKIEKFEKIRLALGHLIDYFAGIP